MASGPLVAIWTWNMLKSQVCQWELHAAVMLLTSLPSVMSLPYWGPAPLSACLSLNDLCRNHGAMDRHEYHSRSRSADQRPTIERPTCRSRSTERPHDSSLMRSMPSLPSGRSAPPSPALTRCDPRPKDANQLNSEAAHAYSWGVASLRSETIHLVDKLDKTFQLEATGWASVWNSAEFLMLKEVFTVVLVKHQRVHRGYATK